MKQNTPQRAGRFVIMIHMIKNIKKRFIIGNWKTSFSDFEDAVGCIKNFKIPLGLDLSIGVCPSAIHLQHIANSIKNRKIILGAQYVSSDTGESNTGETTARQLKESGVEFVIVGHAERRKAHDSCEDISAQVKNAIKERITPIICVGEEDPNNRHETLEGQIRAVLMGINLKDAKDLIFAYEPVWAIGGDTSPKIEDIHSAALCIRSLISEVYKNKYNGSKNLILYGGSVNENNATIILKDAGVQGLLIGRASVDANSFNLILKCISTQT